MSIVDKASDNTIGRDSAKNVLKPHRNRQWVIPPDASAGFVAAMEDVLETYQRPRDPDRPLACVDENLQAIDRRDARADPRAKPGQPARHDYEYERNGVANLFMIFAPLEGWRRVEVTDRHAAVDYAKVLEDLSDVHFPPPPRKSCWFRHNLGTQYAGLALCRLPRPRSPPPRRKVPNGTTRPSTEAGSTWPNPSSPF